MMFTYLLFGVFLVGLILIMVRIEKIFSFKKGFPILMYHKISENYADSLTITVKELERQLKYLKDNDYKCLSFTDLKHYYNKHEPIPAKSVIITFDDGYLNNKIYLLPILERLGMKATIFLPVSFIGKVNVWDSGNEIIMDLNTVKEIIKFSYVELGIHSYKHQNYNELTMNEIENDIQLCNEFIEKNKLDIVKVITYPYGGTLRKNPDLNSKMKEILEYKGYWFGLRIGNRLNNIHLKDVFELFRIDIKGTDSYLKFKIKIKIGRIKLF